MDDTYLLVTFKGQLLKLKEETVQTFDRFQKGETQV